MRKFLVFMMIFSFVLVFAACQTTTTSTTQSTSSTSETTSDTTTDSTTATTTATTTTTSRTYNTATSPVSYDGSYCDDIVVDEAFIDAKLADMTLAEKAGQMLQAEKNGASAADVMNYNLGSILSGGGSAPSVNSAYNWYLMYETFQNAAIQSTSGIPIMYGVDAVHGHNNVYGATMFPQNIGLGAANDPELMTRIGIITAREVRVTGINYTFAPTIAVVQNIAWGRTYESFSESADIVSNLAGSYIEGLQSYCLAASAKHFLADGGTVGGHDQGNAVMTEEEVRAIHLQPYYDAIAAGVYTIMVSYSSLNGVKMHANEYWINDVLKTEMGFDGFVISDYEAIHQLSGTYYDQIVTTINAGVDMLMEPWSWKDAIQNIIDAANNGDISMERINDAVRRILVIKYKMGLFHDDFFNETTNDFYRLGYDNNFYTAENRAVAREAVRKSLVLLKNDNQTLPLSKNSTVALLGEGARNIGLQNGGWTIFWQGDDVRNLTLGTTILSGMRQAVGAYGGAIVDSGDDADTVVIVFSEMPYAEYYGDNDYPTLTGSTAHEGNAALLDQAMIYKSGGKRVIGLLLSGRPMLMTEYLRFFDAFVVCWLPGSEGGLGIADVLFGDYDFTGKLPVTWPKTQYGLGMNINAEVYNPAVVLFPFGYGLSYQEE